MPIKNYVTIFEECLKNNSISHYYFYISGGEPLLNFNVYKDVIKYYYKHYNKKFTFLFVTNLLLLNNEICNWFKELNIHPSVSFDGFNFSKPINGISTSDISIKNMNTLYDKKIKFSVYCVLNNKTTSLLDTAKFLYEKDVFFKLVIPTTYDNSYDENLIKKIILELKDFYKNKKILFDFQGYFTNNMMCSCGKNFISILPDLTISPCNGEINISLGKFDKNFLNELRNNPNNKLFRENIIPSHCKNCEIYVICKGGCKEVHTDLTRLNKICNIVKWGINEFKEIKSNFKLLNF
jgi:radical SAM protein with 4Fe4S-binding SPASM domain